MLSGDKAYELFVSSEPFPLHDFLEQWKRGDIVCEPGYVIAVVMAYRHMVANHNGGRDGTYRPRPRYRCQFCGK